jgi:hypothetical protein
MQAKTAHRISRHRLDWSKRDPLQCLLCSALKLASLLCNVLYLDCILFMNTLLSHLPSLRNYFIIHPNTNPTMRFLHALVALVLLCTLCISASIPRRQSPAQVWNTTWADEQTPQPASSTYSFGSSSLPSPSQSLVQTSS